MEGLSVGNVGRGGNCVFRFGPFLLFKLFRIICSYLIIMNTLESVPMLKTKERMILMLK